ncbi:hypothetical protein [uncultured Sphingomonas sp.]|uniref:hypothetical protein n=1 Tax=uncultured Sphingomonas sp. TaxID=158754 RepID=UPI0035CAD5A1
MSAASIGAVLGRRKSRTNPDFPTDPVRSHSWDVNDPRAQPGRRIGDGSAGFGWAFTEALRNRAQALYQEHYTTDYDGVHPMQRTYVDVLEATLAFLTHATGELNVAYTAIAERAVVSVSVAKRAIAALEHWGFLGHVRRSVKVEGAERMAAPQRKQAPNAYFFDCRRRMSAKLWGAFWSRVIFNLKKLGNGAARRAAALNHAFNEVAKQAPRAKGELAEIFARMERARFTDDPAPPGPSASPPSTHYPELQA